MAKGQKKTVEVAIPTTTLRHWDAARNAYVVDAASYELRVGAASDDIRQTAIVKVAPKT